MDRLFSISHPGVTAYPLLGLKSLLLSPMFLQVLKSKVHRAVVTESNLNYVGSITIDETIMEAADLLEGERVQVVNNNNGARFETYVIKGLRDSGTIGLNGAAARQVQMGDILIIMSYAFMTPEEARGYKPKSVYPDANNKINL